MFKKNKTQIEIDKEIAVAKDELIKLQANFINYLIKQIEMNILLIKQQCYQSKDESKESTNKGN